VTFVQVNVTGERRTGLNWASKGNEREAAEGDDGRKNGAGSEHGDFSSIDPSNLVGRKGSKSVSNDTNPWDVDESLKDPFEFLDSSKSIFS
jgi:hypothetical protein